MRMLVLTTITRDTKFDFEMRFLEIRYGPKIQRSGPRDTDHLGVVRYPEVVLVITYVIIKKR